MSFLLHLLFLSASWVPSILSYNMIFGKGKLLHFGPIGVSVVSAYATFLTLSLTGSFAAAFAAGIFAASVISAFFAWLSFRLEPDGLGIMSIAVHLALIAVVLNWTSLTRGALGMPKIPHLSFLSSLPRFALVMTVIAVLWTIFMILLDRSAFGRKMKALAENEWYAKSLGISRVRVHTAAFLIAGVGFAIIAFIHPQYIGLLHPNDYLFPALVFYITVVVAGKPGSVLGCLLSIYLLAALKEGLRFLPIPLTLKGPVLMLLFGVILFGAVWYRRKELFPVQRTI
jgi:ABC-type branched-subunit amino acid transport system permease subunit